MSDAPTTDGVMQVLRQTHDATTGLADALRTEQEKVARLEDALDTALRDSDAQCAALHRYRSANDGLRATVLEYLAAKRNDDGLSRRDQDERIFAAYSAMRAAAEAK